MMRATFHALVGAYLRHEALRSLLTALGIALGVAVLVAVDLSNESAVASFRDAVREVAGRSSLTVRGNGQPIDAASVGLVAKTPGVLVASPVIRGEVIHQAGDDEQPRALLLLGIDLLGTTETLDVSRGDRVRDFTLRLADGTEPTTLAIDPRALVFTQRFVARHGYGDGDTVRLRLASGADFDARVAAVLTGGGLETTWDGDVVLTDLGTADELLGRGGRVDQIDVVVKEGQDIDATAEALRRALPASVLVERPESRNARVDQMLAAFRFNLRSLGHVALLVGAFLIFNTMKIAVVRRRPAIGTVRAMGASAWAVRLAFLAEGLVFGLAGSAVGVAMGIALAAAMVGTVSEAISINFVRTHASGVVLDAPTLLSAFALGVLFSVGAAWGPASEAAATPPANTMREGSVETRGAGVVAWLIAGVLLVTAMLIVIAREPRSGGLPLQGYGASLLLVGAGVCFGRPLLTAVCAAMRGVYARAFGPEGLLAVAATQASMGRATVALNGLFLSVSMAIAVTVMVSSFRTTVTSWLDQVLIADLYVGPRGTPGAGEAPTLPPWIIDRVAAIDGVARVEPFRLRTMQLADRPVRVGGARLDPVRFARTLTSGGDAAAIVRDAEATGAVIVSEAIARKAHLHVGDTIALPAPGGGFDARVAGIYRDYSSEQGIVLMDRAWFVKHFGDERIDSLSLRFTQGADARAIREAVAAMAGDGGVPPLEIRTYTEIRTFALAAFDQTFAVTSLLQLIAMLVAVLGVATTLFAQLIDRRQEIQTLRTIGVGRARIAGIVVLEASLMAVAGIALGIVGGLVLAWILTNVTMLESFGWSIAFGVPWGSVAGTAVLVFVATLIAALIPAASVLRETTLRTSANR